MESESSPVMDDDDSPDIKVTSTPVRGDDSSEKDESRQSVSPDRDAQMESRIPALMNRTIPGSCCPENRGGIILLKQL